MEFVKRDTGMNVIFRQRKGQAKNRPEKESSSLPRAAFCLPYMDCPAKPHTNHIWAHYDCCLRGYGCPYCYELPNRNV